MTKKEVFKTKTELNFIEKTLFTLTFFLTVFLFLFLFTLIGLGIYIGKFGELVSKVSLVITILMIPPILTYFSLKYLLIIIFKRLYISKTSLLKLKNFFGNLSLVVIAVLNTAKNFIPVEKIEEYSDPPNLFIFPIEYIEHLLIYMVHPVNLTYTLPIVFALMAFLFSFLETSNFATYKVYIVKEKITYITYPNEITRDNIAYLQDITLEIKYNFNQMQSELINYKNIIN